MADLSTKSNYLIERPRISTETSQIAKENNKVAIIEDDEAMSLLLSTILDMQGYEVIKTLDAIPALVIIDAGNAETLKGIELCKKLRSNHDFDKTKIIVTSIIHNKEMILNAGADLYIPKPYEISNLIKWIEAVLSK